MGRHRSDYIDKPWRPGRYGKPLKIVDVDLPGKGVLAKIAYWGPLVISLAALLLCLQGCVTQNVVKRCRSGAFLGAPGSQCECRDSETGRFVRCR